MQRNINLAYHHSYEMDHARGAARKRRAVGKQTDAALDDAIIAKQRKPRSIRQSGAGSCICQETNSTWIFRAIQHLHKLWRNVFIVGYLFTTDSCFSLCYI